MERNIVEWHRAWQLNAKPNWELKFAYATPVHRLIGSPDQGHHYGRIQSFEGHLGTSFKGSIPLSSLHPHTSTMATTSNMFLYSLTLQEPKVILHAITGQFSGTKEQQILTASTSRLTLLRPDPSLGKVLVLASQDVFSIIRSIASFRLAGSTKGKCLLPGCSNVWAGRRQ